METKLLGAARRSFTIRYGGIEQPATSARAAAGSGSSGAMGASGNVIDEVSDRITGKRVLRPPSGRSYAYHISGFSRPNSSWLVANSNREIPCRKDEFGCEEGKNSSALQSPGLVSQGVTRGTDVFESSGAATRSEMKRGASRLRECRLFR